MWTGLGLLMLALLLRAESAQTVVPPIDDIFVTTDYHSVAVTWRYPSTPAVQAFVVKYCELQAWGVNRCKSKVVASGAGRADVTGGSMRYSVSVSRLKMDTEYRVSVIPLNRHRKKERLRSHSQLVRTKQFTALTRCMAGRMEVLVQTGPHFAGRISVEDVSDSSCQLHGDPDSVRQEYALVIDQKKCDTKRVGSQVRTFVVAQEQDLIQTHSTRRFLVICDYRSESLTVSAGVNLPTAPRLRAVSASVQAVSGLNSLPKPADAAILSGDRVRGRSRDARRLTSFSANQQVARSSRDRTQPIAEPQRLSAAQRLVAIEPDAPMWQEPSGSGNVGSVRLVVICSVAAAVAALVAIATALFSWRRQRRHTARTDIYTENRATPPSRPSHITVATDYPDDVSC